MNKIGNIFITIGMILIFTSLYVIIDNYSKEVNASLESRTVLSMMEEISNIETEEKVSNIVNVNGYDYIGTIIIPTLDLKLPIMSQFDYNRLNIAPCVYYGSLVANDLIICGHSYKAHFKYLSNLSQKDRVIFTDNLGNNYVYEVEVIEILSPTARPEGVFQPLFPVTLMLCNFFV